MVSSNQKGSRRERQLINLLQECGFGVMRAPASGSATVRSLPDVLAGRPSHDDQHPPVSCAEVFAFEAKASAGKPIYIEGEEIAKLLNFSTRFGAKARIVAVFDLNHGHPDRGTDRSGMYALEIDDLHETDGGNYRIKREASIEKGTLVEEL